MQELDDFMNCAQTSKHAYKPHWEVPRTTSVQLHRHRDTLFGSFSDISDLDNHPSKNPDNISEINATPDDPPNPEFYKSLPRKSVRKSPFIKRQLQVARKSTGIMTKFGSNMYKKFISLKISTKLAMKVQKMYLANENTVMKGVTTIASGNFLDEMVKKVTNVDLSTVEKEMGLFDGETESEDGFEDDKSMEGEISEREEFFLGALVRSLVKKGV